MISIFQKYFLILFLSIAATGLQEPVSQDSKFKVITFYTGKNDQAHVSFVNEANRYFHKMAGKNQFTYDSINNWGNKLILNSLLCIGNSK